jgi:hypothetical protein
MASGLLGKAIPALNTWNNVYTVPTGTLASISINACNQSTTVPATIDIVISTSSTLGGITTSEYLMAATALPVSSVIERSGLVTDDVNGKYVWVRASTANVSFQVYGYEE